jgi:hypothetical protein
MPTKIRETCGQRAARLSWQVLKRSSGVVRLRSHLLALAKKLRKHRNATGNVHISIIKKARGRKQSESRQKHKRSVHSSPDARVFLKRPRNTRLRLFTLLHQQVASEISERSSALDLQLFSPFLSAS